MHIECISPRAAHGLPTLFETLLKLPLDFYLRDDVVGVAKDLLGKVLCSRIDGEITKAVITETEAYAGIGDKASHAYGDRRTNRTEPMYARGGRAYVYLCYGIHHLFNVVVGEVNEPLAVLVRAGAPIEGIALMRSRRGKSADDKLILGGPGTLTQALGIRTDMTGTSLLEDRLWIEDHGSDVSHERIVVGPRVGIDYAQEDAERPYRFRLR